MADGNLANLAQAREDAYSTPLDQLNPAQPALFQADTMWPIFERLRAEAPVHRTEAHEFGPYWSITKYNDIMAVDTNHQVFSSEGGITIAEPPGGESPLPMFIAMDPPRHDVQRKTVSPAVSPTSLQVMEPLIRERAAAILGRPADRRGIRLGRQGLQGADRHDAGHPVRHAAGGPPPADLLVRRGHRRAPAGGVIESIEQKMAIFVEYHAYFTKLWNERVNAPPTGDLISMLAHGEATRTMEAREYFGNVVLLTVGGNDTTRNTISGSILALNQNPDQYAKLRADPSLIPSMVSETIRWQTPLAHMRRRALQDFEFGGKTIRKGDKVIMWYVSGNRDEEVIDKPNAYIIDRERPRTHISFGFGIHRCVGNRLAELQLKVIWEEILKRFPTVEVVGEPKRVYSSFVKGYESLPVIIPSRN